MDKQMKKPEQTTGDDQKNLSSDQERILFVDDEELITRMWSKILGRIGYKITAFNSPDEAFKAFEAAPHEFDLVITDLSMPRMTGDVLGKAIQTVRPDMPLILCTGFASRIEQDKSIATRFRRVLLKPTGIDELTAAIRAALSEKRD